MSEVPLQQNPEVKNPHQIRGLRVLKSVPAGRLNIASSQPSGSDFRTQKLTDARPRVFRVRIVLYRGTSLIRNRTPLGPHSRTMPRALWQPCGGLLFLMCEVALYGGL